MCPLFGMSCSAFLGIPIILLDKVRARKKKLNKADREQTLKFTDHASRLKVKNFINMV